MIKVNINNLTFDAIIGILPFERTQEQQVVVNCSFKYHFKNNQFIDYSCVANEIKTLMQEKKFELLEDAIFYIKKHLKHLYNMKKLKLCIAKPTILDDCVVEVCQ